MRKKAPHLCNEKDCTGCGTCAQICPNSAINMRLNSEGYYNPTIDTEKCIGCLLCEQRCPVISPLSINSEPLKAYAAWIKDNHTREKSSSGGAFSAIAIHTIKAGGVVWGAGYSENMTPMYKCIERINELDQLRGSKYVQCEVGDSYKQVKSQLKEGRKVLFCGTPCHVTGLYSFLNGKLTENLITVDFICHGVPASELFKKYINWLEKKYSDKVLDFNFRESKFGINYNIGTSATFKDKGKKFLYLNNNSYTLGFCRDLTIHKTCFTCKFRDIKRCSDFTIGDFHGAKGEYSAIDQFRGISCFIVNSTKGNNIVSLIDLEIKEVPLTRIIKSNPSYAHNTDKESRFNLNEAIKEPYNKIQEKYFKPSLKDYIKFIMMKLLGGKILYLIKNLV